jgi:hypothetical protein
VYDKVYNFWRSAVGRAKGLNQVRTLATGEARRELPRLVQQMAAKAGPSDGLLDDAVGIGPHRKGGAVLVPEIDAAAHLGEVEELRTRVEELEDDLEDAGMALFIQARIAGASGERLSPEEFLRGIGMEGHVDLLPRP